MDQFTQNYVDGFMADLIARNPGEKEFHQAVKEVLESVAPYIIEHPYLMDLKILERIVEPERIIIFRVPWLDDEGEIHVNRGYRVLIGNYCSRQLMVSAVIRVLRQMRHLAA